MTNDFLFINLLLISNCRCALETFKSTGASELQFAFKNIVLTIRETFPACRSFNYVHEFSNTFLYSPSTITEDGGVNLILDLMSPSSLVDSQQLFHMPPVTRYNFRNHQPCSVIFFELDFLLGDMDSLTNHTIGNRWPERFLRSLPNTVHQSFFIFFTLTKKLETELDSLIIHTAQILHFVFVILQDSNEIHIFKGLAQLEQSLRVVATINSDNFETEHDSELFYTTCPNFKGQTIMIVTCMICKSPNQDLIRAGMSDEPVAYAWIRTAKLCNASREFELAFEAPGLGVKETGDVDEAGADVLDWDELMVGVAEGTAGLTVPITNSPFVHHVAWLTRPLLYDGLYFVTAQPKLSEVDSILVLSEPLELEIWLGLLISLLIFAPLMQLAIESKSSGRKFRVVIEVLLRPVVNQSSVVKARTLAARILLGSWLLCTIVIGCGYSSKFITTIAFPLHVNPPRTFDELAASDYELGVILYNIFMKNTKGLSKNVLTLLKRVKLMAFSDPESYQMIFEGRQACIGPWKAINKFGIKFMVDTDGNRMFRRSDDVLLFGYAQVAVSRHYPMLIEPLDKWMGLVDQSGMTTFVRKIYYDRRATMEGKSFSQGHVKSFPYYKRKASQLTQGDRLLRILARLLIFGFSAAALAFFSEMCSKALKFSGQFWNLRRSKMKKEKHCLQKNELFKTNKKLRSKRREESIESRPWAKPTKFSTHGFGLYDFVS